MELLNCETENPLLNSMEMYVGVVILRQPDCDGSSVAPAI